MGGVALSDLNGFLERLKNAVTLSSVIGRFITVKRHGHEFQACCPFHDEKTPSFTINDRKGFYHCFGCGQHGDVISFMTTYHNIPFMEAVQQIADIAGMRVPSFKDESLGGGGPAKDDHAILYDVLDKATAVFEQHLAHHVEIQQTLLDRAFTHEDMHRYRMGYAPLHFNLIRALGVTTVNDHGNLTSPRDLKTKGSMGFSLHDLIQAGLVVVVEPDAQKDGKTRYYSRFRDRIMIPIQDRKKRVIAFGGRMSPLSSSAASKQTAKYINSPETPLFHKSSVLFGIHHLNARDPHKAIVVMEGYFDVIRAQKNGINALAPLGTALTTEHMQALWKLSRSPILCFDGDAAGQKAAFRAMTHACPILKPGYEFHIMTLPKKEDPDSFIRTQGVDAFLKRMHQKKTMVECLCEAYRQHVNDQPTPEGKARVKQDFMQTLDSIADQDIQGFYKDAFFAFLRQLRYERKPQGYGAAQRGSDASPSDNAHGPLFEKIFLVTLIHHPTLIEQWSEELFGVSFSTPGAQDLMHYMLTHDGTQSLWEGLSKNADALKKELTQDVHLLDIAPFARAEASDEDAQQGLTSIWDDSMRRIFLEKALSEQKEKLKIAWNIKNWHILQNIQKELDTFFNQSLSHTGEL